ncbi:MAG: sulfotransferase domain-containing protein [Porticoccus sp.]
MTLEGKKNTFILGVGAPKAGTTWLYSYLNKSKHSNLGCLKEYHVWDAKFIDLCDGFKVKIRHFGRKRFSFVRYLMQNYQGFYECYFRHLVAGSANITADITPAYCGLSESNLSMVKAKLQHAGFDVKVVFLMRDPVERCWSATRMRIRTLTEKGEVIGSIGANQIFKDYFSSDIYGFRTRYENTVKNLRKVFSPSKIYYGVYEEMFEPRNIEKLSQFLGVEFSPEHSGVVKNASPNDTILDEQLIELCRSYYSDTYAFCNEQFPQTRTLWRS